jgi:hypothetical protein
LVIVFREGVISEGRDGDVRMRVWAVVVLVIEVMKDAELREPDTEDEESQEPLRPAEVAELHGALYGAVISG